MTSKSGKIEISQMLCLSRGWKGGTIFQTTANHVIRTGECVSTWLAHTPPRFWRSINETEHSRKILDGWWREREREGSHETPSGKKGSHPSFKYDKSHLYPSTLRPKVHKSRDGLPLWWSIHWEWTVFMVLLPLNELMKSPERFWKGFGGVNIHSTDLRSKWARDLLSLKRFFIFTTTGVFQVIYFYFYE